MLPAIPSLFTDLAFLPALSFLVLTWILVHRALSSLQIKRYRLISFSVLFVLLVWLALVVALGKAGTFAQNPLVAPFILIGFIVLFALLQKVYASKTAQAVTATIPMHWLIAIQTYRIAGIVFFSMWAQGVLPAAFAFPSGIGDILIGITAPFVAFAYYRKKPYATKLAIWWNIIGILDLVIALGAGMLGFPRPIQTLPLAPSTEALSLYPLAVIPLFAVPLALLLHALGLKVLREKK